MTILVFYGTLILYNQNSESLVSGVKDEKLAECPESPNCVSTQTEDNTKKMEPIAYIISNEEVMEIMVQVINEMSGTKIMIQDSNYLHVTFTTRFLRFVDDVEFYFDEQNKLIHFRSASRTGYSDMGVNQERMVEIRERFLNEI
ncbi:DUF1499 domain-containing protein [Chengkuizengella sp. YPA3-1-1]|uniref:DUF1499 domain-containing protein n=2 Tax=Chengkuizengella marina TaxID=2507566 RepID=A0A6N9Q840_9BACL|nr:DUF1499 domain-containing protein [Chengkuizengella marina]